MHLDPEFLKRAVATAGYAVGLGVLTAGGLVAGAALDRAFGTEWMALLGVAVGFSGGLAGFVRGLNRLESRDRRPPDAP